MSTKIYDGFIRKTEKYLHNSDYGRKLVSNEEDRVKKKLPEEITKDMFFAVPKRRK